MSSSLCRSISRSFREQRSRALAEETVGTEAASAARRTWRNYWRPFYLLALFGAMTSYVTSAMAAHLPGLLLAAGTTALAALPALRESAELAH
jgi:hypothetical protein